MEYGMFLVAGVFIVLATLERKMRRKIWKEK